MYNTKKNKNKKTSGISLHSPNSSIIYILSLVLAQDSTPGFIHATLPTTYDINRFFWMWGLPGSLQRARLGREGWALCLKHQPEKKDPHGDKAKESQARHGFYKLVMVLFPSPAAEHIYCEGNCTNNRVAFALTVSKCCLGSFKRQLNFSVPHCHRDRTDDFTELFPEGEISWLHVSLPGTS